MWSIVEDLKDQIGNYEKLRELCKRDLVNAYLETDRQVITAQIDLLDNFIERLEYTIEKASQKERE